MQKNMHIYIIYFLDIRMTFIYYAYDTHKISIITAQVCRVQYNFLRILFLEIQLGYIWNFETLKLFETCIMSYI